MTPAIHAQLEQVGWGRHMHWLTSSLRHQARRMQATAHSRVGSVSLRQAIDLSGTPGAVNSSYAEKTMKSSARTALLTGIPFGLFMGIFFAFQHGPTSGVIAGIACGISFGLAMSTFAKQQKKKFQVERPLLENESLIKEGGANHFKNMEGVGGWIYLTDKRILFKSHSVNIQKHELSIPLHKISEAKACMTFRVIPNGLRIQTTDGNEEKFVVEGRSDWVKNILEARTQIA